MGLKTIRIKNGLTLLYAPTDYVQKRHGINVCQKYFHPKRNSSSMHPAYSYYRPGDRGSTGPRNHLVDARNGVSCKPAAFYHGCLLISPTCIAVTTWPCWYSPDVTQHVIDYADGHTLGVKYTYLPLVLSRRPLVERVKNFHGRKGSLLPSWKCRSTMTAIVDHSRFST